jgi:hypothetical protein
VRPKQLCERCTALWHVVPEGSWDLISKSGFRTAEQLIRASDADNKGKE